jgi:hypothetical protein
MIRRDRKERIYRPERSEDDSSVGVASHSIYKAKAAEYTDAKVTDSRLPDQKKRNALFIRAFRFCHVYLYVKK